MHCYAVSLNVAFRSKGEQEQRDADQQGGDLQGPVFKARRARVAVVVHDGPNEIIPGSGACESRRVCWQRLGLDLWSRSGQKPVCSLLRGP